MATYEETHRFCVRCKHHVVAKRKATNHILHLLISVFTGGLWLIVWLGLSMKFGGWRCQRCGGKRFH